MRTRGLLTLSTAILASACTVVQLPFPGGQIPGPTIPMDAGTVPLDASGDGVTLLLGGLLSRERFIVDSVKPVGSRLASRSPDPDQFRAIRYGASGQMIDTIHMRSPLDSFEWDAAGRREQQVSAAEARVVIPVPVHIGVTAVELQWPDGASLGRIDVEAVLLRFCAGSPLNPSCRTGKR